jgi:hypothetical protein
MSKEKPDYHDADLALRVYEMRREAVMRESRAALAQKFWPKSYEDVAAVVKADHPLNAAWRQVGTYWEMVYGLVKHGIVNADYFLESNGEGLFHFAKVEPYLESYRKDVSATAFGNVEWVTKETATGRRLYEAIRARVKKMAESR